MLLLILNNLLWVYSEAAARVSHRAVSAAGTLATARRSCDTAIAITEGRRCELNGSEGSNQRYL